MKDMQCEEKSKLLPNTEDPRSNINQIKGYVFGFLATLSNVAAVLLLQAVGKLVPIILLQTFTFGLYFLFAVVYAAITRVSLQFQSKQDLLITLVMSFSFGLFRYLFFTSALYLPPSTCDGMFFTVWILFAFLITICSTRKCEWHILISVILCLTGIILLSQPIGLFPPVETYLLAQDIPCDNFLHETAEFVGESKEGEVAVKNSIWQSKKPVSAGFPSHNYTQNWNILNFSSTERFNSTVGRKNHDDMSSQITGFIFNIASSLLITVYGVCVKHLKDSHHDAFLMFWPSLISLIISGIFSAILWESPHHFLAAAWPCHILLVLHCLASALISIMSQYGLTYLLQEEFALISSVSLVFMYISQLTFMSKVHPGRGNVMELIGAIVIFIGNVVSPVCTMFCISES